MNRIALLQAQDPLRLAVEDVSLRA